MESMASPVHLLPAAPEDLTRRRLKRLGEGIGKVVYASDRWVVKRERYPSEIISLILIWKAVRKVERCLPGAWGRRLIEHPAKSIRLLRLLVQGIVLAIPRSRWLASHSGELLDLYRRRDRQGESLAREHLTGSELVPERIAFPPTRVKVGSWPGWIVVAEAVERVESTLHDRINDLARARRFDEIEVWLQRLLDCRLAAWQRGVFSLDAHLKNFGVTADRVVLLDAGGLTNRWTDIENRLELEDEFESPHERLGLGGTLRDRPDIAARFDARWRATVNPHVVRQHWPLSLDPRGRSPAAIP
jgi:hypothetical protein